MKKDLVLIVLISIFLSLLSFVSAQGRNQPITNIQYKGNNQVEISSEGRLNYTTSRYPNNRLVVNIQGGQLTQNGGRPGEIAVNNGIIQKVTYSQFSFNPMITRIVYHLTDEHEFRETSTGKSTIFSVGKEAPLPVVLSNTVSNIKYNGNNQIEIESGGKLNYTTSRYPNNRLVMDIQGTQLTSNGGRTGNIVVNNGTINSISYSQFSRNPMTTRIVYHLTDEHEFRETPMGKSTIFSVGKESPAPPPVSSNNAISNIKYNGSNQIEIESGGKLNYSTSRYPNNRLVMDIQGTQLTSNGGRTGNIAVNNGTINSISYSQFSRNPMITRIVYHLTGEHGFTEYFTGNSTRLTIGSQNNTQPPAQPAPTPEKPNPEPKPVNPSGSTIVIDPGHGGKDPGAVKNGLQEKVITLQIAQRVESQLKNLGYNVIMTRSKDEYLTLSQRAEVSNNANGEIFISIHANSFTTSTANGIETFHYVGSSKGIDLATYIQTEVIKATGAVDRGVKVGNFQVLRDTRAPAALIEVGFISNPDEAKKLSSESYQQKVTDGLIIGIQQYLQKY